jgi:cytochrome c-type biogenesis protein CcmF
VGTPAIDSNIFHDVYLTIDRLPAAAGGPVSIGVIVQPLVVWLWVGGAILVLGSLLALVPCRRRRPTDPVSAPVPAVADLVGPVARLASVAAVDVEEGRADERVPAGSP